MITLIFFMSAIGIRSSYLSSSARVIESDSTRVNSLVRGRLESLPAVDAANDMFTPDFEDPLNSLHETVPEFGRIELGALLYVSSDTVEYAVRNHTNLRLRYMHDCREGGLPISPHPSLKLMWYSNEAISVGLNLTSIPLFVSPPVPIPQTESGKAQFSLSALQRNLCCVSGATVRLAVLSVRDSEDIRLMMCADLTLPRIHRFVLGMELGIKLIRYLQLLHSRNILRGDIHPGYARIARIPQGVQFLLDHMDVSSSWILPDGFSEDFVIPGHSATFLSPWEMLFTSYTKRDEIFRAILTIANWVCYYDYEVVQSIMSFDVMLNWKMNGNIFVVPEKNGVGVLLDPLDELKLSSDSLAYIRECLDRIMKLSRNDDIANPQYDLIIENMRNIVTRILDPPTTKSGSD